jgi:hypothetical protein
MTKVSVMTVRPWINNFLLFWNPSLFALFHYWEFKWLINQTLPVVFCRISSRFKFFVISSHWYSQCCDRAHSICEWKATKLYNWAKKLKVSFLKIWIVDFVLRSFLSIHCKSPHYHCLGARYNAALILLFLGCWRKRSKKQLKSTHTTLRLKDLHECIVSSTYEP